MECRIATLDEVKQQFNYLICVNENKDEWIQWKTNFLEEIKSGMTVPFYGFLDGECICEAYAEKIYSNIVYLKAFRTKKEFQNQGYFSQLYHFMMQELSKQYQHAMIGVEEDDEINTSRYKHYGFTTYIGTFPSASGRCRIAYFRKDFQELSRILYTFRDKYPL